MASRPLNESKKGALGDVVADRVGTEPGRIRTELGMSSEQVERPLTNCISLLSHREEKGGVKMFDAAKLMKCLVMVIGIDG